MFPFVRGRAANVTRSYEITGNRRGAPASRHHLLQETTVHTSEIFCKERFMTMKALEIIIGLSVMLIVSVFSYALCKVAGEADEEAERLFREMEKENES